MFDLVSILKNSQITFDLFLSTRPFDDRNFFFVDRLLCASAFLNVSESVLEPEHHHLNNFPHMHMKTSLRLFSISFFHIFSWTQPRPICLCTGWIVQRLSMRVKWNTIGRWRLLMYFNTAGYYEWVHEDCRAHCHTRLFLWIMYGTNRQYWLIYNLPQGLSLQRETSCARVFVDVPHNRNSSFTFIILEDNFFVIFWIKIFFGKPNSIRSSLQTVASLKACNNIFLTSSLLQMMFLILWSRTKSWVSSTRRNFWTRKKKVDTLILACERWCTINAADGD